MRRLFLNVGQKTPCDAAGSWNERRLIRARAAVAFLSAPAGQYLLSNLPVLLERCANQAWLPLERVSFPARCGVGGICSLRQITRLSRPSGMLRRASQRVAPVTRRTREQGWLGGLVSTLIRTCPSFDTLGVVRPVVFHPKARDAIRAFPREIRDRLGKALFLLQAGEQPGMPLSRPMPSVAPGVSERRRPVSNFLFHRERQGHFGTSCLREENPADPARGNSTGWEAMEGDAR